MDILHDARHREDLAHPNSDIIAGYVEEAGSGPTRAESLHEAARFCRTKGLYERGYQFAKQGLEIPWLNEAPNVENWIYEYGLLDELAINAYWTERYAECVDSCDRLLTEGKLPTGQRDRILKNKLCAVDKLREIDTRPTHALRILYDGCPLCKSVDIKVLRHGDCSKHHCYHPIVSPTITWMICQSCSHVYTDGYFSPEVSAIVFAKTQASQLPGVNFEQQRNLSANMVAKVAQYVSSGSWLDVGFGNGSLLFTAKEWGFSPVGIDLRPSTVEAMQQLGFEAHCVDIQSFGNDESFDVLSMADVLEHMPYPIEGLSAARRLLRRGGILLISMPNYNCPAWRLLDASDSNPYWGEIEHFHNFSSQKFYAVIEDMGFTVVQYGISERYRICMEVLLRRD
jgi:SAM-dependent methyltransferase